MQMKKIIAALLTASMVLTMTACGNTAAQDSAQKAEPSVQQKTEDAGGAGTADGAQVEIRFSWWGDTKRNEVYNTICDRFEEANPGIKVMREPVSWSDFWTKMATQSGGGNAPDVFGMHPQYAADYALRGTLLDLQPWVDNGTIDTSNMSPTVVDSGKYEDKLYMISQGVSFTCYLVNNDLAEEYGVTLPAYDEDWSWDQFKEEAEKFASKAKDKGLYFAGDSSMEINCYRWAAREAGGDLYTEDGQLGFEEQTVVDWLAYWKDLRDKGCIPDPATATEDGTLALEQRLFTLGKSVLYNMPVNQLYLYQAAMPDKNVTAIRVPTSSDGQRAEYIEGAHFAISSNIDEAHQEAAAKLINFFVNTEESMELFKMEQGVPANEKMAEFIKPLLDEPNRKAIDFAVALMQICKPATYSPKGASEIDTAYKTAAQKVSYGQSEPAAAAAEFMKEAKSVLAKN